MLCRARTFASLLLVCAPLLCAQEQGRRRLDVPGTVPHDAPPIAPKKHLGVKGITEPDEPEHPTPAATDFRDARYGLSFHVPAGWNFEKQDGQLSNFGVDVRSTTRKLDVRGVATINYNPYPVSTFAGATFYYSVTPRSDAASCTAQAVKTPMKPESDLRISGLPFHHGRDQHGNVCTESRDDVFTAMRGKSCLRFDLVVNTFCAQSSGAMEISSQQLGDIDTRLASILDSIHLDLK